MRPVPICVLENVLSVVLQNERAPNRSNKTPKDVHAEKVWAHSVHSLQRKRFPWAREYRYLLVHPYSHSGFLGCFLLSPQTQTEFESKRALAQSKCARSPKYACITDYQSHNLDVYSPGAIRIITCLNFLYDDSALSLVWILIFVPLFKRLN